CLCQIQGRKRCTLFPPQDTDFLYDGQVDPERPDIERFPLFDRATAYECTIEPGDTLFTPSGWWHHVRGLEKSITVSYNFFNDSNLATYIAHILGSLRALARSLEQSPEWRKELRIKWNLPIS